jgi:sec-independent protein translocase protein TatB
MLGLGPLELLVIAAVAVIFIGPERLPKVATQIGRWYRKIMETTNTVKKEFDDTKSDDIP